MNACKKTKYLGGALTLAAALLFCYSSPVLAQHEGAAMHGGAMPGGITMQAVSGKVVETMDGGGYTYALVDKAGARTWVAMPKSKIAVGDEISCRSGMVMNNFTSNSLKRTFEHIVFSGGIVSSSSSGAEAPHEALAEEKAPQAPKEKPPEDWKGF